ncbi:MAG: hypothetical protein QOI20_3278 [Acidimicrobiaceae bacterium]|jgi:hypothetical protein|nr:hypothetical protein [Acidimicrobiaceae bacterium]
MADFAPGSLYVDVPQTNMAVRRFVSDGRFIATKMVPKLVVKKPSGLYTTVNVGDLNRDELEPRGPTAAPKKAAWGYGTAPFKTDARSLEYDVNDAAAAAADVERNPELLVPRVLAYKAALHTERRMAATFFTPSAWYRTVTGAGADNTGTATAKNRLYFDNAGADIIEAIQDEIRIQSNLTGMAPEQMGFAMGGRLWHKVRNAAKIKAQVFATINGNNTLIAAARAAEAPQIAALLGIKWVGVSTAIYNAALENETPNNLPIVPPDDGLLFYSPTAGDENGDAGLTLQSEEPAAFARFVWNGVASDQGIQIRKVRDEKAGPGGSWANIIDVYNGFGVITPEAGTYFQGMVTP